MTIQHTSESTWPRAYGDPCARGDIPIARPAVVTELDRRRLDGLLALLRRRTGGVNAAFGELERGLARATVVPAQEVPPSVVTMNSQVRLRDVDTGAAACVSLVFPGTEPRGGSAQVSVLAPLGAVLLGRREGDEVRWRAARGVRRVRIERILYQPEAAGHFWM